jgi:hypothetical protein
VKRVVFDAKVMDAKEALVKRVFIDDMRKRRCPVAERPMWLRAWLTRLCAQQFAWLSSTGKALE